MRGKTFADVRRSDSPGARPRPLTCRRTVVVAGIVLAVGCATGALAHIFIFESERDGAIACEPGTGWTAACWYDVPDSAAANLLTVEAYIAGLEPTFTFKTDYIDWPAGDDSYRLDDEFATLGEFLAPYAYDFSDPDAPNFSFDKHFVIRCTGWTSVQLEDSQFSVPPPVWMDYGLTAYDGGRVKMGNTTIFRIVVPTLDPSFYTDNAIIDDPGGYKLQVTYFNRYDPTNAFNMSKTGVEFYACYEDGLLTPGGTSFTCEFGQFRVMPPWRIYQEEAVLEIIPADWDIDDDVDLMDYGFFQNCYTGPGHKGELGYNCGVLDLDVDFDVDLDDYSVLHAALEDPNGC